MIKISYHIILLCLGRLINLRKKSSIDKLKCLDCKLDKISSSKVKRWSGLNYERHK